MSALEEAYGEYPFDGIEPEVWHYRFGDYEVLPNYLKERKRRGYLDSDLGEPTTFRKIATAIAKTIEIQKRIDEEYMKVEASTIMPPGIYTTGDDLGLA